MILIRLALVAVIFSCPLGGPAFAEAQTAPAPPPAPGVASGPVPTASRLATTVFGGIAGLGLAVAYIAPDADAWLVSDERAFVTGVAGGLVAGLLADGFPRGETSSEAARLTVTAGMGSAVDFDYSVSYRVPLRERTAVEGALLVMSDSWERVERETRCSFLFGCITGDFVVDHRYRQNVGILVRGIYALRPAGAWNPGLTLGAGPVIAHTATPDNPDARAAGLLADVAVTVGRGARTRWNAEAGYRLTLAADPAGVGHMGGPYARVGVGLAAASRPPVVARGTDASGNLASRPAALAPSGTAWSLGATALPILAGVTLVAAGTGYESGAGTALNSSLLWGGALVGPATGYMRTGRARSGLPGLALRVAMFGAAWAAAPTHDFNDGFVPNPDLDSAGVWLVATAAILISDAIDIRGAGRP